MPEPTSPLPRHFTVTGFVSVGGRTALHWHARLQRWLPPGGHVERDEDPVQAVLREVHEETGLEVDLVTPRGAPRFAYAFPPQLATPAAMAVYDIPRDGSLDGPHQHVDFIYFTRPRDLDTPAPALPSDEDCWAWVDETTLQHRPAILEIGGRRGEVAEDVRELALAAIAAVRDHAGTLGPSGAPDR